MRHSISLAVFFAFALASAIAIAANYTFKEGSEANTCGSAGRMYKLNYVAMLSNGSLFAKIYDLDNQCPSRGLEAKGWLIRCENRGLNFVTATKDEGIQRSKKACRF